MQVANDNLLDVFYFVTGGFNCSIELMLRFIPDSGKDIRELWSPDLESFVLESAHANTNHATVLKRCKDSHTVG